MDKLSKQKNSKKGLCCHHLSCFIIKDLFVYYT